MINFDPDTDRRFGRKPSFQVERDIMQSSEASIEAEIQEKGLNAPRLNPAHIDAQIVDEDYHVFPGTTCTVCCLKLRNGFTVIGKSAAASPENFNEEIGRKVAREDARKEIWALEGYLLCEKLFEADAKEPLPE